MFPLKTSHIGPDRFFNPVGAYQQSLHDSTQQICSVFVTDYRQPACIIHNFNPEFISLILNTNIIFNGNECNLRSSNVITCLSNVLYYACARTRCLY